MPFYTYRAVSKNGKVVTNKVEEVSKSALIAKLKRNGFMPITVVQVKFKRDITKKRNADKIDINKILRNVNVERGKAKVNLTRAEKMKMFLSKNTKITSRDLVIFTQNFYLLKKANFNNIHALSTLIEGTENLQLRVILEDILSGVEAGETMYSTMEYYSDVFPYIYVNMIKVGELSGSLTSSLGQAVKYLDNNSAVIRKLKQILIPNVIQFVLLLVMLIVGTIYAIPQIQNLFDELGTKETLPAITIAFSNFVDFVVKIWYIPTIIIAVAIAAIVANIQTPKGKYNFHYFKYTMPIFGKLIFSLDFTRFMRALLLNIENGMRIQEAMEVSKNVIQNYVLLSVIETAKNNVIIGQSWIEPFEKVGLCSPMALEMLKIGMHTDLTEMIGKLIEYMDIDIDNIMDKIMKILPQLVYSIVGVVIIFFVLVILVPMIQVYMGTFLFSAYGY